MSCQPHRARFRSNSRFSPVQWWGYRVVWGLCQALSFLCTGATQGHHICRASVGLRQLQPDQLGCSSCPSLEQEATFALRFLRLVQKSSAEELAHLKLLAAAKSAGSRLAANDAGL